MKISRLLYFIIFLFILFSLDIYANNDFRPFCRWPNMMMWGWGGLLMCLLFLLFIGLIVYLIIKSAKPTSTEISHKENTALEILKRRYAKGEVSKEEFERMKKDLED